MRETACVCTDLSNDIQVIGFFFNSALKLCLNCSYNLKNYNLYNLKNKLTHESQMEMGKLDVHLVFILL